MANEHHHGEVFCVFFKKSLLNQKMLLWLKPVVIAVATIASAQLLAKIHKDKIDRFAMGIVRDIGRFKAKKRRNMNSKGLISTLMKQDDLDEEMKLILNPEDEDQADLPTYTDKELLEFGSGIDGKPILIGVLGHVYDVSAGSKFYGEDGDYYVFAGHDITYSLATGCKTQECVNKKSDKFEDHELSEAKRWLSFFHLHDKYKIVGKMESNYVDVLLDSLIEASASQDEDEDSEEAQPENGEAQSESVSSAAGSGSGSDLWTWIYPSGIDTYPEI